MSGRRGLALLLTALAVLVGACTDVTTDPLAVVSIEFDSLPAPSVVRGDTLRDTSGAPAPLSALAFNVDGEPIPDAPVTFIYLAPDTTAKSRTALRVDAATRYVIASDTADVSSTPLPIVAQIGALQSRRSERTSLRIVPRPTLADTVQRVAADTALEYLDADTTNAGNRAVNVQVIVRNTEGATPVPVGRYLVQFAIPPDSAATAVADSVRLVSGTRRFTFAAIATGDDGIATARVRVYARESAAAEDSIVVQVRVRAYDGTAYTDVAGSPLRRVVRIRPRLQP